MKVSELIKELNLDLLTKCDFEDRDVTGCYIGDLWAGQPWVIVG